MAIAFDAAKDGGNNGGGSNTQTWSHTCTGSDLLLIVGITGDTSTDDITAVTYNGVACTLVGKVLGARWEYMYYLLGPATGAHTVSVTAGSSHYLIGLSASYTGVAQSGQPDNSATTTSASSPVAISLTTVADNCWTIATGWLFSSPVAGAGTTRRILEAAFLGGSIWESSTNPITPAGNSTLNMTWGAAQSASLVMASFKPVGGGGGSPLFRPSQLAGLGAGGPFFQNPLN